MAHEAVATLGLVSWVWYRFLLQSQPRTSPTPQSVIDAVPVKTVEEVVEGTPKPANVECPVCQEEFKVGEAVAELPRCGHRYMLC